MDEAQIAIVARMRDEASPQMQHLGRTAEVTGQKMITMQQSAMITSSALSSMGSLLRQIDNPLAKTMSNFLMIASAVLMSYSAMVRLIPVIKQVTAALQAQAAVRAVLAALSGPAGWAMLGVGAAVGVGATVGITRATRSREEGPTQTIYVQGSIISERELSDIARRNIVHTQQRNAGKSGIT